MPTNLLHLLKPLDEGRSARGNIPWLSVIEQAAVDAHTVALLREIPSRERRELLAETGRAVYARDLGNYRAELHYNTEELVTTGQLPTLPELLADHTACLFTTLSDTIDLAQRESGEEHLADSEIDIEGIEYLQQHLGTRGVVLLSVFQSHIGYLKPALPTLGRVALIRKPDGEEGADALPPALLAWKDAIELVPADVRGGIRLLQILRKRGVVGLYNDFLYPDARATKGWLFGRTVPISSTLLQLIRKTRAVVVPLAIARTLPLDGNQVTVRFFPPVEASVDPSISNQAALALQISIATECLIRSFPVQWRLWNTLRLRWKAGQALR